MDLTNIRFPIQDWIVESIRDPVGDYVMETVDMMIDINTEFSIWKPVRGSVAFMGNEL